MTRSKLIPLSALMALCASSPSTLWAQDQRGGQAAAAPKNGRAAQPAQRPVRPIDDPVKMQKLLKIWEGQSAKLKTLDMKIYRVDRDGKWGAEVHFDGRAILKDPNLAYLNFKKVKLMPDAKGKPAPAVDPKTGKPLESVPHETIVCSGDVVWQYEYETRQIYKFPLAKDQRQRALDEGPLPFLFNMKAEEAAQRYEMHYRGEDKGYYSVEVIPRLPEDKDGFRTAYIKLDKVYMLPRRIVLLSPDGNSVRDFSLTVVSTNHEPDAKFFKGGVYRGWKVVENPPKNAQQKGRVGAQPGGAGGMPRR